MKFALAFIFGTLITVGIAHAKEYSNSNQAIKALDIKIKKIKISNQKPNKSQIKKLKEIASIYAPHKMSEIISLENIKIKDQKISSNEDLKSEKKN